MLVEQVLLHELPGLKPLCAHCTLIYLALRHFLSFLLGVLLLHLLEHHVFLRRDHLPHTLV